MKKETQQDFALDSKLSNFSQSTYEKKVGQVPKSI